MEGDDNLKKDNSVNYHNEEMPENRASQEIVSDRFLMQKKIKNVKRDENEIFVPSVDTMFSELKNALDTLNDLSDADKSSLSDSILDLCERTNLADIVDSLNNISSHKFVIPENVKLLVNQLYAMCNKLADQGLTEFPHNGADLNYGVQQSHSGHVENGFNDQAPDSEIVNDESMEQSHRDANLEDNDMRAKDDADSKPVKTRRRSRRLYWTQRRNYPRVASHPYEAEAKEESVASSGEPTIGGNFMSSKYSEYASIDGVKLLMNGENESKTYQPGAVRRVGRPSGSGSLQKSRLAADGAMSSKDVGMRDAKTQPPPGMCNEETVSQTGSAEGVCSESFNGDDSREVTQLTDSHMDTTNSASLRVGGGSGVNVFENWNGYGSAASGDPTWEQHGGHPQQPLGYYRGTTSIGMPPSNPAASSGGAGGPSYGVPRHMTTGGSAPNAGGHWNSGSGWNQHYFPWNGGMTPQGMGGFGGWYGGNQWNWNGGTTGSPSLWYSNGAWNQSGGSSSQRGSGPVAQSFGQWNQGEYPWMPSSTGGDKSDSHNQCYQNGEKVCSGDPIGDKTSISGQFCTSSKQSSQPKMIADNLPLVTSLMDRSIELCENIERDIRDFQVKKTKFFVELLCIRTRIRSFLSQTAPESPGDEGSAVDKRGDNFQGAVGAPAQPPASTSGDAGIGQPADVSAFNLSSTPMKATGANGELASSSRDESTTEFDKNGAAHANHENCENKSGDATFMEHDVTLNNSNTTPSDYRSS